MHLFSTQCENKWQCPILVTGNPGIGKSHAILGRVSHLLEEDVNIMIATPTGFLASGYHSQTPDEVTRDTVHSSFTILVSSTESIPVSSTESSKIN